MGNSSYEEIRQRRIEENNKKLKQLKLLPHSFNIPSPPSSSMKKKKLRKPNVKLKQTVPVRRSSRVSTTPQPSNVEVALPKISSPKKGSSSMYASEEERKYAIREAEKLDMKLKEEGYATLIRPMLPSHTMRGFWLGLPNEFCRSSMANCNGMVTLVDEESIEYPVVYIAEKNGLSGGWKGFAEGHDLVDGDVVIFQVIKPSVLKVYILRASGVHSSVD